MKKLLAFFLLFSSPAYADIMHVTEKSSCMTYSIPQDGKKYALINTGNVLAVFRIDSLKNVQNYSQKGMAGFLNNIGIKQDWLVAIETDQPAYPRRPVSIEQDAEERVLCAKTLGGETDVEIWIDPEITLSADESEKTKTGD